jgi:hypothetical protein
MNYQPGFLLVKPFPVLYAAFYRPADVPIYAIPVAGVSAAAVSKQYRGIDREPLEPWTTEMLEFASKHGDFGGIPAPPAEEKTACLALAELEVLGRADRDFVYNFDDALRLQSLLESPRGRELIWAAPTECNARPPVNSELLGFEPTWFDGDHFSALCDCMCFPRWHGTDVEGTLFQRYFERLNQHALFASARDAEEFLAFYRSHDWTETGDYVVAEIRVPVEGA